VQPQRFTAVITSAPRGRVYIPIPFDPDTAWGTKPTHHITGTVNGRRIRGSLQLFGTVLGLGLGPAWRRGCGLEPGSPVEVTLTPEGPQRADLAEDIATALAANPAAATFFDSLATFYRTGYLRWINATTRRPDLRAARIAEMITLLAAGQKQRD
jgi:hypothetical protein